MALSEHLSAAGRAALAEVIEYGGGTPGDVLEEAVLAHRDAVMRPRPCAALRLYLCDETVISAGPTLDGQFALSIAGPCVAVDLATRATAPTAAEVDAIERIYDGIAEARDLFRTAHRRATRDA